MDLSLQWAIAKIVSIINPQFFGSFTLTFENGKLVRVKTEQTEKPPAS